MRPRSETNSIQSRLLECSVAGAADMTYDRRHDGPPGPTLLYSFEYCLDGPMMKRLCPCWRQGEMKLLGNPRLSLIADDT